MTTLLDKLNSRKTRPTPEPSELSMKGGFELVSVATGYQDNFFVEKIVTFRSAGRTYTSHVDFPVSAYSRRGQLMETSEGERVALVDEEIAERILAAARNQ